MLQGLLTLTHQAFDLILLFLIYPSSRALSKDSAFLLGDRVMLKHSKAIFQVRNNECYFSSI